jgi:hypothetical protein
VTRIAIVTVAEDLHAYAVRKALEDRHGVACEIIETDRFPDSGRLTWSLGESFAPTLPTLSGREVDVRLLDLVWFRRPSGVPWRAPFRPAIPADIVDETAIDIIVGDCRATFIGILLNEFRGIWVSHPDRTRNAENKLLQLRAAQQAGLRVPQTLISQNPDSIRKFCASLNHQVLVKTTAGTRNAPLTPGHVDNALLASDRALRLSPAIYQEVIPGNCHLRVHVFGDQFYTAMIRCENLDWRFHLAESVIEPYELSAELEDQLSRVLRSLGLRMGIFDIKLTPEGEPVWLEVNPQGQFLFIEGLSALGLTNAFADFLVREIKEGNVKKEPRDFVEA